VALPEGVKAGDPVPFKPGFVWGASGDYVDTRYSGIRLDANAPGGANNPISESEAMRRYGTTQGVNVSGVPTKPYVEGHDSNQIPTTPEDAAFSIRTNPNNPAVQAWIRENPAIAARASQINKQYETVEIPISDPRRVNPGPRYETTTTTGQRIVLMGGDSGEVTIQGTQAAIEGSGERLSELGLMRPDARLYGTKAGEPGTVGGIPFTPKSEFGYELKKGGVVQFFEQKTDLGFTPASPYGYSTKTGIVQLKYGMGDLGFTPASPYGYSTKTGIVQLKYGMGDSRSVPIYDVGAESDYARKFPSSVQIARLERDLSLKLEGDTRNLSDVGKAGSEFLAQGVVSLGLLPVKAAALAADLIYVPGGLPPEAVRSKGLGGAFGEYVVREKGTQAAILAGGIVLSTFKAGRGLLFGATAAYGAYETLTAPKGETFRTAGQVAGTLAGFYAWPKIAERFARSRVTVSQGASEVRVESVSDIVRSTRKVSGGQKIYSDVVLDVKQTGYATSAAVARDRLGNLYPSRLGTKFETFTSPKTGETIYSTYGFANAPGSPLYRGVVSSGRLMPFEKGGPYQVFSTQNVGGPGGGISYSTGYAYEALTTKGAYEFFPSGKMVVPASQVTRYPFERTVFLNYEVAGPYGFDVTKAPTGVKTLGVFERVGKSAGDLDFSRLGSFVPDVVSGAVRPAQTGSLRPPSDGGGVVFESIVPLKGRSGFSYGAQLETQASAGGITAAIAELSKQAALTEAKTSSLARTQGFAFVSGGLTAPRQAQESRYPVNSRSVVLERQTLVSRQTILPKLGALPSEAMVSRSLVLERQVLAPRSIVQPRTALLPDTLIVPETIAVPRIVALTRTQALPSTYSRAFTPAIPLFEIPIFPGGGGGDLPGGFFGMSERPFKRGKRGYRYTPSLTAIAFDIRTASFPKVAFGEVVRPIVSPKGRGTKPFFGGFDFF
jgi:hypothetical protein